MSYERFTLTQLRERFAVTIRQEEDAFGAIAPAPPSDWLVTLLDRHLPLVVGKSSEKARSEFLVAPILAEVREMRHREIAVFSGVRFDVDRKSGLLGFCDFLISRDPLLVEVEAPVLAVAEAKKEDLNAGVAQCIAEMVAAERFNQQRGHPRPTIYGALTSGTDWRFLRLDSGTRVTLDLREYPITQIDFILGILVEMTR